MSTLETIGIAMIPEEAYNADISHFEFRLLAVLCRLAGQEGTVEARISELGVLTGGTSESTVKRALRALEKAGFISRGRTRLAAGYYGLSTFTIQRSPVTSGEVQPEVTSDLSELTNSLLTTSTSDYLVQVASIQSDNEGTSYLWNPEGVPVRMVHMRKFEEDDLPVVGALDDPKEKAPVSKRDTKTRRLRPQDEWTSADVAAEFSFQVSKKAPWLPGAVNIRVLASALAKYRKQYGTTALVELEILRMFMANEDTFRKLGTEEPTLYKKYLKMFNTHLQKAHQNLGLDPLLVTVAEPVSAPDTLQASDGRIFQNSMAGRVQLQRYEGRISK